MPRAALRAAAKQERRALEMLGAQGSVRRRRAAERAAAAAAVARGTPAPLVAAPPLAWLRFGGVAGAQARSPCPPPRPVWRA